MIDPTPLHVILMYGVGIVMGVLLTLWWQTFAAQMRKQAWDNVSKVYDKVLRE